MIKMLTKIILLVLISCNLTVSQITEVNYNSRTGAVSVLGLADEDEASICYQGTNGNWSINEAKVTCRHLEYQDGEARLLTEDDIRFVPDLVVFDFVCNGDESSLADCNHGFATMSDAGCGSKHYAGVGCFSTDCGGAFNSASGNLTSPNFPYRYPTKADCEYTISVPSANMLRITFQSLDLENGHDYLDFGRSTERDHGDIHRITGAIVPDPFDLSTGSMWFRFSSDRSVNHFGFSLSWEVIDVPDVCYHYFNDTMGTFTSPNYPNPYPGYTNCTYIINIPDKEHITIQFQDLDLEYRADMLYYGIGTVPSLEHKLGDPFTGSSNPGTITLPSTSLWFIFQADGSISGQGFSLNWDTSVIPEVKITGLAIQDDRGVHTGSGYVLVQGLAHEHWVNICYERDGGNHWGDTEAKLVCTRSGFGDGTATALEGGQSGWVVHNFQCDEDATLLNDCTWNDTVHSRDGCGLNKTAGVQCSNNPCDGIYRNSTGTLQSPNYPARYPPLSNCTYLIDVPNASRLYITFERFRLERTYDTLRYYETSPATAGSQYGTLTGIGQQAPLEFYTNRLWLRFTTDLGITLTGFSLSWEASYKECRMNFTDVKGNFTSPNYPLDYPHLANCTYFFSIPEATRIEFSVVDFSTEESSDGLHYGNGTTVQINNNDFFTGTDVISPLVIHGGFAWFVFTSDLNIDDRGFNISWEAFIDTGDYCGHTFTDKAGSIQSPNFPARYPPNMNCIFVISVQSASRIRLDFKVFDLEDEFDYLYYGAGTNFTWEGSITLTGSFIPDPVELMTNSLWFRFNSDSSINNYGFAFSWEAIDGVDCHGYYTKTTGNLTSPNYPSAYPGFSDCMYIIDIAGARHITISFRDMALEYRHDFLYYGIGTEPSVQHALATLTGYTTPSHISLPTSSMWFLFETDGSGGDVGFALSWDITSDAPETEITDIKINGEIGEYDTLGYVTLQGLVHDHWAQICDEGNEHTWSDIEAKLVCRRSGFDNGTAVSFNEGDGSGWVLHNFQCNPDASTLNDCTWDNITHSTDGCGSKQYAGVQCSNTPCDKYYTNPTGVFRSPDFPLRYPPLSNCTYVINVPGATRLRLTFNVFRIEHTHDHLRYYPRNPATNKDDYGTLTGIGRPAPLEVYSNTLWLRFLSDRTIAYSGFSISWNASFEKCVKTYKNYTGHFSSPNYPSNYPHLANCTYYFDIPEAVRFKFFVRNFSLESSNDRLYFGNGSQKTAYNPKDFYTGKDIPSVFEIYGSFTWFNFVTDVAINGLGFLISWEATVESKSCGETFTSRFGTIESPNYPDRYPPNLYCTYMINVTLANRIRIEFQTFDLEDGYDYLTYGPGTNESKVTQLTGEFIPDPIELMTGSLWFEFTTDHALNNYGFAFTWEALDVADCHQYYTNTTGAIVSPNYPNPYPGFANCTYIINIPGASHIAVSFQLLDLEYHEDFLYYGTGTDPSVEKAAGLLTGYTTPNSLAFSTSSLWFIFDTNGIGSDQGFSLTWDTTSEAPDKEITDILIDNASDGPNHSGNVSVMGLTQGMWAQICYEGDGSHWGDTEAILVCKQSGYDDGTAIKIEGDSRESWILNNFQCKEEAANLNDCKWGTVEYTSNGCGAKNYAGVRCFNKPCIANFSDPSGILKSPNFPFRYPPYSNCTYVINVPDATRLRITFDVFWLENEHDYLRYYQANPVFNDEHHGSLTGIGKPAPLEIYTNLLWLRFTSDVSVAYTGFKLSYQASYEQCSMTYTESSGNFSSPNYPDNYPHMAICTYLFQIPKAAMITFTIQSVSIEYDADRLYYGSGKEVQIGTDDFVTGTDIPLILEIQGDSYWFLFTSDLTVNGPGFMITWKTAFETSIGTKKPPSMTTPKATSQLPTKPTGHSGNAAEQSQKHRRAMIVGYILATMLLVAVIIMGYYIYTNRRNRRQEYAFFRTNSSSQSMSEAYGKNNIDQSNEPNFTAHQNAAFEAEDVTVDKPEAM